MSMPLSFTQNELKDFEKLISTARLSSYSRHLGTTGISETYGAYMWSTAVSASFFPLIQAVEIGFRNSMNDSLSPVYGHNWFEQWVSNEANDRRYRGSLKPNQQSEGERSIAKAKEKITKRDKSVYGTLPAGYVPKTNSVLAEMTFGFWVRFLIRWYWDVNHNSKLWPNHLGSVFPGAPSHLYAVGALHNAFNDAVDLRNRIHHQEPLWKNGSCTSIDDATNHLLTQLDKIITLLGYLSPYGKTGLEKYGAFSLVRELCTKESFYRFTGYQQGQCKYLRSAKKDLRLIAKDTKDHQSVWVLSDSDKPLIVVRNANRRFF